MPQLMSRFNSSWSSCDTHITFYSSCKSTSALGKRAKSPRIAIIHSCTPLTAGLRREAQTAEIAPEQLHRIFSEQVFTISAITRSAVCQGADPRHHSRGIESHVTGWHAMIRALSFAGHRPRSGAEQHVKSSIGRALQFFFA